ncbi:hypothetical protein BDV26DRAFT_292626 [Aspergillus bertholletiae]|uniref:Uncharacterized protein n=1 Tax=Aspergillus bertholletiae TaxID=1226010 RepID=A0A5N7B8D8_9EURO|nr:hypothetical protein BDV26DRAFT_292626 [Aspergillus bertholletiae]
MPKQCADVTLILYSDSQGYLSRAPGLIGFSNKQGYYGCATLDDFSQGQSEGIMTRAIQEGKSRENSRLQSLCIPRTQRIRAINAISVSTTATPPSSVSSQVTRSTTTAKTSSTSGRSESPVSQGSSRNTGAFAGGVVGGVCGALLIVRVIWFVLRRGRRRSSMASQPDNPNTLRSEPVEDPTSGTTVGLYEAPT